MIDVLLACNVLFTLSLWIYFSRKYWNLFNEMEKFKINISGIDNLLSVHERKISGIVPFNVTSEDTKYLNDMISILKQAEPHLKRMLNVEDK